MNVTIIAVDKIREPYLRTGCELYVRKLAPYFDVTLVDVRAGTGPQSPATESDRLLERVPRDAELWALDRSGAALSSAELAAKLGGAERSGRRRLALVIGGANGLHQTVLQSARFVWSLSPLTFLHEMARLIVLEQLYRAAKINRGEPYHR